MVTFRWYLLNFPLVWCVLDDRVGALAVLHDLVEIADQRSPAFFASWEVERCPRCLQGWRHTFTDCSGIRNFPVGREKGIGERWVESLSDDKNNGTRPRRRSMSDDVLLDQAAQLIADARVACLKLAIPPAKIAKIMMDEAILALMAERLSLSDIQATFKKYAKRDLPRFYMDLRRLASDQAEQKSPN
jgi:hypothetical protein